jgi:hypothetical protein
MRLILGILLAAWLTTSAGASDTPPRILDLHLSSHVVHPGDTWSGRVSTSGNVASVEMHCVWFSISLPRERIGVFAFRYSLLDVPVVFRRVYAVTFVARNAAGERVDRIEQVDFR